MVYIMGGNTGPETPRSVVTPEEIKGLVKRIEELPGAGSMYDSVAEAANKLNDFIRETLQARFGGDDARWPTEIKSALQEKFREIVSWSEASICDVQARYPGIGEFEDFSRKHPEAYADYQAQKTE